MGFGSFHVQAKNQNGVEIDHCSKDLNLSTTSSDDISSVASFDSSSDEEDNGDHTSSQAHSLNNMSMSSLLQQLPIKRGLSKHYEGRSKSFACLSNVRCLEDLAKPEHPYKKLKFCKSYAGFYGKISQRSNQQMSSSSIPQSASSRLISKKTSRGSCSSFINNAAKRTNNNNNNNNNTRPPPHPASYNTQAPLFEAKDSLRCDVLFPFLLLN